VPVKQGGRAIPVKTVKTVKTVKMEVLVAASRFTMLIRQTSPKFLWMSPVVVRAIQASQDLEVWVGMVVPVETVGKMVVKVLWVPEARLDSRAAQVDRECQVTPPSIN